MPPRRVRRGGSWSEVIDLSGSEDTSDGVIGPAMEEQDSSKETGQSGCVNRLAPPSEHEESNEQLFPTESEESEEPRFSPIRHGLGAYRDERE
ncbi:unnamed protein product [Arabis nemorensis]|uniref:Uncharacterized protein n=1 Tax=Arabis nemorensis TaxID=586526 RepID=A0A565BF11_9BRAS|nr:unnamed protein product [Arabis nemorensis]